MLKHFEVWSEGDGRLEIDFDDERTVGELVDELFDRFGYYEPAGMRIVTLFASASSRTHVGWFAKDRNEKITEAFAYENTNTLCIAYNLPGVFYYAEGGWGNSMSGLGNHPELEDARQLHIRFNDFNNTVVIAGRYSINDVRSYLCKNGYLDSATTPVRAVEFGCSNALRMRYLEERDLLIPIVELVEELSFDLLELE